jgi:hypothetical protein
MPWRRPANRTDALTLLHELQVHQVELDLQAQELHESRAELESTLRRQIELYDHQPVGCFAVDSRCILHELNLTGADMLGVARDEAYRIAPRRLPQCRQRASVQVDPGRHRREHAAGVL